MDKEKRRLDRSKTGNSEKKKDSNGAAQSVLYRGPSSDGNADLAGGEKSAKKYKGNRLERFLLSRKSQALRKPRHSVINEGARSSIGGMNGAIISGITGTKNQQGPW